jgi:putative tryptophan/tyrosine transport system substrate-binding protein
MKRREFIAGLGGAAAWPVVAGAQQPAMPVIGSLASFSAKGADALIPFYEGLHQIGYVEGRNVAIEYRWAENRMDRLPELANDLVRQNVSVIGAFGGGIPALAAKAATSTIPIVFVCGEDPVKIGLVAGLGRTGANLTGVTFFTIELGPKRLELLRQVVPNASRIAMLVNPSSANVENKAGAAEIEAVVRTGEHPIIVEARSEEELEPAFARLSEQRADAVLVVSDPLFTTRRQQLITLAANHALPTMYPLREFAADGGLASYGASVDESARQAGVYAGKILRGAKPSELPVVRPTKVDLTINLKTAKALGLDVPPTLLARADEVIE